MVHLPAGATPVAISAGVRFNLAIGSDGKLYSWGTNGLDQLGSGINRSSSTPVVVRLPSGVTPKVVAAGRVSGLAVGSDGKFYAWGYASAVDPVHGADGHTFASTPIVLSFMSHASRVVLVEDVPRNIPLAQTAEPLTRAYPGVDASVSGIRMGMTVSQVEAIAAKQGLGTESKQMKGVSVPLDNFIALSGRELQVDSKPYVDWVEFNKPHNVVQVYFSSPATGNRSEAVSVDTVYPSDPKANPSTANGLVTSLLHKYGPPSNEWHQKYADMETYLWWDFDSHSLLKTCGKGPVACFPAGHFDFRSIWAYDVHGPKNQEIHPDFYIVARVNTNRADRTKAGELDLAMGDIQFATLDRGTALTQARNQLKIAAEKDIVDAPEAAAKKRQEKRQEELKLVPKF